ncbi:MAG: GTP-binding protein [Lachnospiraceae bacterium]|nr:GTP-binding protein [Lachnospiraceae bacterium]
MKILILGGFLGSGKTTILLQLAQYLTEASDTASDSKIVILENEAGQKSIDNKLLESSGLFVKTLFNGCICCSLSGEIVPAIIKIEETCHPEWLIIETTGLAYPGMIQENLKKAIWMDSVICTVVDSFRWKRFLTPMYELIKGQVSDADIIFLNKKDLVESTVLDEIKQDIAVFQKEKKQALCFCVSALEPIPPEILNTVREVIS